MTMDRAGNSHTIDRHEEEPIIEEPVEEVGGDAREGAVVRGEDREGPGIVEHDLERGRLDRGHERAELVVPFGDLVHAP